ncbi:hypothetical protein PMIN06_005003 [Paraphaeosphaeria minitans]
MLATTWDTARSSQTWLYTRNLRLVQIHKRYADISCFAWCSILSMMILRYSHCVSGFCRIDLTKKSDLMRLISDGVTFTYTHLAYVMRLLNRLDGLSIPPQRRLQCLCIH